MDRQGECVNKPKPNMYFVSRTQMLDSLSSTKATKFGPNGDQKYKTVDCESNVAFEVLYLHESTGKLGV